ncbi:MAG: GNAT family N-acetyltransferase [Candidatus Diapherotrites archaeon]|nr:GNAT family N-acetyltransferase [Candidatus Diapherotrites archaeon]
MINIIRKAKASDSAQIYHLGKKIHELDFSRKYPFHELSEIKEFISRPKENILFVVEENKEIIGFVFAKILSHHAGGWCMLDNIGVEKQHRHKGIANELLHALYKELKKRKVWYVQILEGTHHKSTRHFWKKQGYKETKTFVWAEKKVSM